MNYMNITNQDITDLSEFYGLPEDQLIEKSISEILTMRDSMMKQKATDASLQRAQDTEYIRIVKKYLEIYPLLAKYWSDADIIPACARHMSMSDIVQERYVPIENIRTNPQDCKIFGPNTEYIRTSIESVPRYARSPKGEELLHRASKQCHVYRTENQYQGIHHGDIALDLLYNTYPELKEFDFGAYEYVSYEKQYEIYPKSHIYTPFDALMARDINAIIDRNMEYAKSYNAGIYTPDETEKRLTSEEAMHYFHVIENLKSIGQTK